VQDFYHDGTPDFFRLEPGQKASAHASGTVFARLRAPLGTVKAWVESFQDGEQSHTEMQLEKTDDRFEFWTGRFPYRNFELTRYRFKVIVPHENSSARVFPKWFKSDPVSSQPSSTRSVWFGQNGVTPFVPTLEDDFKIAPGTTGVSSEVPDWVSGAVFYQIFPDRFRDGDPSNNVYDGEYSYNQHPVKARTWGERPDPKQGFREFFGGDLEGIRQSIPYLTDLGVNALYLNPIFKSPSSHKYDTEDYFLVDPHFGTNESFRALVTELHANGIRVILDGVFNHAGIGHKWFKSGLEGAASRRFFTFTSEENSSYVSWLGVKTLPKLDYASTELQDVIYKQETSIVQHWLKPTRPAANDGVDGWRLDVIHMMGEGGTHAGNHAIIQSIRTAMRQANPDAYLLGEHFFEATPWLQGLEEDGAMNYHGFTWPVWGFLVGADHAAQPLSLDAAEMVAAMQNARAKIPWAHQLAQFNQIDSHDVPRFSSLVADAAWNALGAALLMTYIGVPCVYYGDEIGLQGGPDPDNRRPMPWNEADWNTDIQAVYKRLIELRRSSAALQRGGFEVLHAVGDALAFVRQLKDQAVITALTRGAAITLEVQPAIKGRWRDAFSNEVLETKDGVLQVALTAESFRILILER
jgi:alpha-glucosidase